MTGGLAGVETSIGKRTQTADVDSLKKQRDECLAELQGFAREESALETKKSTIQRDIGNLENRIKYTKVDLDFTKKKIQSSKEELKDIESSLERAVRLFVALLTFTTETRVE
jgi:chromosome segregation ATPase